MPSLRNLQPAQLPNPILPADIPNSNLTISINNSITTSLPVWQITDFQVEQLFTKRTQEIQILLALFQTTGGSDSWNSREGWLSDGVTPCDWQGVTCNDAFLVTALEFSNHGMVGTLPASMLWDLTFLERLDLSFNPDLNVDFEQQVTLTSSLAEASGAAVGGAGANDVAPFFETGSDDLITISKQGPPSTSTASATTTTTTTTPVDRKHATALVQDVNISQTATSNLQGILDIKETLRTLDISQTEIATTTTSSLSQLHRLTSLSMNNMVASNNSTKVNSLSTIIHDAAAASSNGVESTPWWPSLQEWHASNAGLTGALPLTPMGLTKLQTLDLSNNRLSGTIPKNWLDDIQDPNSPTYIDLQSNQLEGGIPTSFDRFSLLTLDVTDNSLTTLPAEFCEKTEWMEGAVGRFGCAAIACPPGSYNKNGRQVSPTTKCRSCPGGALFYGTTECDNGVLNALLDENIPVMATESERSLQREVLTEFYLATEGDNWALSAGWLEGGNTDGVCAWYGVSCENGVVRELNLPSNNLQGTIPPSLFRLTSLRRLILLDNLNLVMEFSGPLSDESNVLSDLQGLILSRTATQSLSGISIVAPNLFLLDVNGAQISGSTLAEVFSLSNLKTLNMGNNYLQESLPTSLGNLSDLVSLRAPNAALTGTIPSEIGLLTKLVVLELSENSLEGQLLTETLNPLQGLRILDVSGQQAVFDGPLPALHGLPSLLQVDLSLNAFSGSIPTNFLQGTSDKTRSMDVNLKANRLTGSLPQELAVFQSLNLDVTGNQLEALPSAFCTKDDWMFGLVSDYGCDAILCPPSTYNENGRMITMENPCAECPEGTAAYFGSLECTELILEATTGPVVAPSGNSSLIVEPTTESPAVAPSEKPTPMPSETPTGSPTSGSPTGAPIILVLSQRDILTALFEQTDGPSSWVEKENWLDDSKDICEWYGVGCTDHLDVRSLVLSGNGLQRVTPSQLFQLSQLERLYLDGNPNLTVDLSGLNSTDEVPRLTALVISNTATVSTSGISRASFLQVLDLNMTDATGDVMDEVTSLTKLESLNLGNTRLDRALPDAIGGLGRLREFVAPNSGITGTIPEIVGDLTDLAVLDLSVNKLSGPLPLSLERLTGIRILELADCGGIRGRIPALDKLTVLTKIDFSGNQLSGPLPVSFLSGIRDKGAALDVNLENNLLRGKLPESLTDFLELNIDVTTNLISDLPESFCLQELWMNGSTQNFGCDAILCPPNTFNVFGRQIDADAPCEPCLSDQPFFGSVSCSAQPVQNGTMICPDGNICYNEGVCVDGSVSLGGAFSCDCSGSKTDAGIPFAGLACEYKASDFCHTSGFDLEGNTSFCTNNGWCKEFVPPGAEHQGCDCNPELWEGEYCELRKGVLAPTSSPADSNVTCPDGHVCQNGGRCLELGPSVGAFTCNCSDDGGQLPFAGSQCQYMATSLCSIDGPYTSFCANGGACRSLADAGSEHDPCTCPSGFSGEHCQIPILTNTEIDESDIAIDGSDAGIDGFDTEVDGSENSFAVTPSSDDEIEGWQMALVFVLPAMAILAIVALIIVGYSRKRKANLKFVDADYLADSEYDKYKSDDAEAPGDLSNLSKDDISGFDTPPSIVDRALGSVLDEPLTNGTAYFSLPGGSMDYDLNSDGKMEPAQLFDSPESATSSVTRSTDREVSPVDLAGAEKALASVEAETSTNVTGSVGVKTKGVRINDTPNIVTLARNYFEEEEDGAAAGSGEVAAQEEESEEGDDDVFELSDIEEEAEDDSVEPAISVARSLFVESDTESTSFIGDIVDPGTSSANTNKDGTSNNVNVAAGRSLFSGIQNDNDDTVSFLESSVAMSDDSERSNLSESQRSITRVLVSMAPSLAQSMFSPREASETSSGELSLNF